MAVYTVRIELHEVGFNEPSGDDYENLHAAMQRKGYFRVIQTTSGNWYHLPNAEYSKSTNEISTGKIAKEALSIAESEWDEASVFVTKSNGRHVIKLKPASAAEVRQLTKR